MSERVESVLVCKGSGSGDPTEKDGVLRSASSMI